ncbi:MAG: hypothetical protein HY985_15880 [Magnetospirillum sp.]|nr:hypothetical protein [Magnetospirillum sp.]
MAFAPGARAEMRPEVGNYVAILVYMDVFRTSFCGGHAPATFRPQEEMRALTARLSPGDREQVRRFFAGSEYRQGQQEARGIVRQAVDTYRQAGRSEAEGCQALATSIGQEASKHRGAVERYLASAAPPAPPARANPAAKAPAGGVAGMYWCNNMIGGRFTAAGTVELLPNGAYKHNGNPGGTYRQQGDAVQFDGNLRSWANGRAKYDGNLEFDWKGDEGFHYWFYCKKG